MTTAHIVVSIVLGVALAASAALTLTRYKQVLVNMARAGVPESWLPMLGTLKAAGAVGVLVGLAVPLIGTAAAIGVILFFIGAVITHLRIRDYAIAPPVGFGLLAATTLVLGLATY